MRLPHSERSRAVLIGTSTYAADSGFAPVPQVAENLTRFAALLRELTNLTHIEVLADPDGPEDFARALEPAVEAAEDLLLFYYSGHGVTIGNDSTELALTHRASSLRRPGYSTLPYSVIRDDIRSSRAAVKVVILDCCHSGKAFGHGALAGESEGEALRSYAEIEGAYVLTAATRFAAAHGPDGCTAFTGTMLRLLRTGDPDGGEFLTFTRLFALLDAALRSAGFPRPRATGRNTAAELALARNTEWSSAPTAPVEARPVRKRARSSPLVIEPPVVGPQAPDGVSEVELHPRCLRTIKAPAPVLALTFSPFGEHLGLACSDGRAVVIDLSGRPILPVRHGRRVVPRTDLIFNRRKVVDSRSTCHDIDFTPDGSRFATAVGHGAAKLWDAATGDEVAQLANVGAVHGVRFSPNGKLLATLDEGRVLLYDSQSGGDPRAVISTYDFARCSFSPDGVFLATTTRREGEIRIWNMDGEDQFRTIPTNRAFWLEWDPRGDRFATINMDGDIALWDIRAAIRSRAFRHRDWRRSAHASKEANSARGDARSLTFSPDGRLFATVTGDNTIRIWNPDTGSCLHTITHDTITTRAAFSPDGRLIATAARDKTIQLWELNPSEITR
ncbi:hypothetical protein JMUB6875_74840 [Nocardia sp. JMUB6875]